MTINSLLITNLNGNIVFSKYYNSFNEEKQNEFEKILYQLTKDEWIHSKNEKHLITEFAGNIIVFTNVGELLLFLCGSSDEYDELALSDIMNPIVECLKDVCKKKGVSELFFIEQIPKFVLYIDEIIQRGYLDQVQFEIVSAADEVKVVSSSITRKSTNVMSAEMDFALMDITFDKPLYTYMNVICPNFTCPAAPIIPPQIDCTCDYTNPQACPQTGSGCPSCPTEYTETDYLGNNVTIPYCDYENDPWTTIQTNTNYFYAETSDTIKLRLKADNSICQGLRLYGTQNTGSFYIYVSTNPSEGLGRRTSGDLSLIPLQIGICPSDNTDWAPMQSWTNNTYFISLTPIKTSASFGFIVYSSDISAPVPPAQPCTAILPTHQCINDGDLLEGEGQSEIPTFYTFVVDRPMVLSFGCPLLFEDIDFFISDSPNMTNPDASNFKWSAMRPYDDYLTLTLKPWNETTPKILYISIIPYYPSKFQCTVTTHTNNTKRAITDNYDLGGTYLSMGTSRLIFPDGTHLLPDIWQNTDRFYSLFPRVNNNPLWPIPNILFDASERFNFFSDISFADPTNPPLPNTYQAAFILSIDRKSTTVFSDYSNITRSKLEFLDILVDADGNPVVGAIGFTPVVLPCNYTEFQSTLAMINSLEDQLFATSEFQNVSSLRFNIDVLTMRDSWAGCTAQAKSLLQTQTVEKRLNTTRCPYSSSDPRYALEPCCNSTTTFFECCVPRELLVETTVNIGVYNDLVSSTCSSYDCTVSLLNDYYASVSQVEDGSCALTFDSFFDFQLDIYTTLRRCKMPVPTRRPFWTRSTTTSSSTIARIAQAWPLEHTTGTPTLTRVPASAIHHPFAWTPLV
ncbi:hypothetical protein DFA_01573 [Cavenderia fasciculata]|uniref:AP complex mu/sigma subunit domain-containing protein n=1 Tax=Cavenderia fasciculata TaxID=261658 RepID=F4PTG5_CACFS|nr:uncharacterized protein DFA_01573 [Cavenderia fasciculata]EGG21687.1 hypothetical protein DFA_01573 [Cavenderia fasciculata]|eukprot:XP_004359537.1 hypothetical protein DFA_01573 [Cavenderia fasciculata]